MQKRATLGVMLCVISSLLSPPVRAQDRASADASIDAMRGLASISQNDQDRIRGWIGLVVDELAATPKNERDKASAAFRDTFGAQLTHSGNKPAFRAEFVRQVAAVATTHFAMENPDPIVTASLARVLLDANAIESLPGLMAGLTCKVDAVRYLCARAIIMKQREIAADNTQLPKVIQALRDAGVAETSPIVLGRIYRALAFDGQAAVVIDAYLAIFDARLTKKRSSNTTDGAEVEAFLYFSDTAVIGSLNQAQKTQVVARVAVFLRLEATRYADPLLGFIEIDDTERSMVQAEVVLSGITKTTGGDITKLLLTQGRSAMALVPPEAAKWVGDTTTSSQGTLNAAPWNVPVGAP